VKPICDKSNRFHKRVIKNPAGICNKKERCQLSREPESRQNGSMRGFDLISDALPFGRMLVWRAGRNQATLLTTQSFARAHMML
jgi:hypothetical protein